MNDHAAHLSFPPREAYIEPSLQFIAAAASRLGAEPDRLDPLQQAARSAMELVMRNQAADPPEPVEIALYEEHGRLVVEVINRGVPILPGEATRLGSAPASLPAGERVFDRISVENRGRQGQSVLLEMKLGEGALPSEVVATGPVGTQEITDEAIVIRPLQTGEEGALSRLFYYVYGYQYINEFVYYPERIKSMIAEGRLLSTVAALPGGRLLGHVGLMKWNDSPLVYEPCLGVTDPAVKSRGLFSRIYQATMELADRLPMQYCFCDLVTNHDYSQRLVARYGTRELALFVGCQNGTTQARLEKLGMGDDPRRTDRYSLLYAVMPKVPHPFGKELLLPGKLGEMLGFLLKPLNMVWTPAPRFSLLPPAGEYQFHCEPVQQAVLFDLKEPGRRALEHLARAWTDFLRDGYRYAAVELPVEKPGLGMVHDFLAEQGFFVSGFVPYHRSDRLGLRLQALAPTKVDFGEIKVFTDHARELLETVRADYERNAKL